VTSAAGAGVSGAAGAGVSGAVADEIHRSRLRRLTELISAAGADRALISAAGTVGALTGVWLETGAIMPSRNPWLLTAADGSAVLLVDEFEAELAARRCAPGSIQPMTHRGSEARLRAARSWLGQERRLAVDLSGISAADLRGLSLPEAGVLDVSAGAGRLGRRKSAAEVARMDAAASAMTAAVARACAREDSVGAAESALAGGIAGCIYGAGEAWYDVVPIVSSGGNLRVPHARPGQKRLERGDLCRIGARGRFGPFHIMYVRTAVVRADRLDTEAGELAELAGAHEATVLAAHLGATLPARTGQLTRVPVPAAQGMGFDFKEAPTLDADSADRLEPGDTVLISTILQRRGGDRLYWQQLAAAGADDVLPLGTRHQTETELTELQERTRWRARQSWSRTCMRNWSCGTPTTGCARPGSRCPLSDRRRGSTRDVTAIRRGQS
jgi:Xaa-Pro aminopeptidase